MSLYVKGWGCVRVFMPVKVKENGTSKGVWQPLLIVDMKDRSEIGSRVRGKITQKLGFHIKPTIAKMEVKLLTTSAT